MPLLTLDEHGSPAYSCTVDSSALTVVADGPILRCPTCGHSTDEPGDGVLGDGFDIVHRQWGTRGDPHAWRALRDVVAAMPTPTSPESVRRAFVEGLRQVADVDIDTTDEKYVYRRQLDHGGMSGGNVNVEWWRTKGLPLLVDRAMDRRPLTAAEPASWLVRQLVASILIWAIILAIPTALVTGGGWLIYQRYAGTRVEVTVLDCDTSGHVRRFGSTFRTDCVAQWTIDGRTVVGNFEGGNGDSDTGRIVDATVRGDTAYSRSLTLPLLLVGLSLPFLLVPGLAVKRRLQRSNADLVVESDPPPAANA